ncbi:MAG TPA: hypothetical protein VGC42_29845 [Kofleriaceae bacterium]
MIGRRWLAAAAALAALAACKKPAGDGDPAGSGAAAVGAAAGSGAAGAGAAAPAGSGAAAPAPARPAPVEPAALDKALADRHVAASAVVKRASGPGSQWALIAQRDKNKAIRGYDLLRVRAADAAVLHLAPPDGNDAQLEDLASASSLEVRDLDADGNDDALVVADWERHARISDRCQGCYRTQDEEASQLFVVSGDAAAPRLAFSHLVKYASHSEGNPESNTLPVAAPDDVAYDWKIAGAPPVLALTRRTYQVSTEHRLAGTLTAASEPLLSAGAGKDVPLVLQ